MIIVLIEKRDKQRKKTKGRGMNEKKRDKKERNILISRRKEESEEEGVGWGLKEGFRRFP